MSYTSTVAARENPPGNPAASRRKATPPPRLEDKEPRTTTLTSSRVRKGGGNQTKPGGESKEPCGDKWKNPGKNLHNRQLGMAGEEVAAQSLQDCGYVVVDRNWRCKAGEVDIVALSPDGVLAFVEVKTRSNHRYGMPIEAITMKKLGRMRRVMGAWLAGHDDVPAHRAIRLDLMSVDWNGHGEPVLKHLKGLK